MRVSFFCGDCGLDEDLEPVKDRLRTGEEYFFAKCMRCRRKLVRYITEKNDPYFRQSLKLKVQRKTMAKDLIQYGQDGFSTLYKREWDKIEAAREEYEQKQKVKEQERVDFFNKYRHNVNERELAKKVIEGEEKIYGGS